MIMFGFEVDTLEIALKQQQDLVDKIFILESSFTHRGVSSTTECNDTLYKQDSKIKMTQSSLTARFLFNIFFFLETEGAALGEIEVVTKISVR